MNKKKITRYKLNIKSIISGYKYKIEIKDKEKTQKIIVALSADYGNLGDVAISYAQKEYLKKEFPDAEVIDFPISDTFTNYKALKSIVREGDIITIVGGGNTGDMYDDIEFCRQFIIKQFSKNRIVCFPQTIDFSNSDYGKKALKSAIKTYKNHKQLILSARENKSLSKFKNDFENKVVLAPDIVLSLNLIEPKLSRKGITLCMRKDEEKKMTMLEEKELIEYLKGYGEVEFRDTHIDKKHMNIKEREIELDKIWTKFKKSELVITDRLHGMIFCAITGTPCIAIDNSNAKISGVYEAWLKDYDSIKVLKEFDLEKIMENISLVTQSNITHKEMCFETLKSELRGR